jgi:tRNA pseudouridine55 synthase
VLAAEIGRALGCGGHLATLRRTRFGAFAVRDAHELSRLEAWPEGPLPLVSIRSALAHLRELIVPCEIGPVLRRGQQAVLGRLPMPRGEGEAAKVVTTAGDVVAIIEADTRRRGWRLVRTLAATAEKRHHASSKLYKPQTAC